jgi:hypothetical protein
MPLTLKELKEELGSKELTTKSILSFGHPLFKPAPKHDPSTPCELCGNQPTSVIPAVTNYPRGANGENPNKPRILCAACEVDYVESWQEQWDEYYANVI